MTEPLFGLTADSAKLLNEMAKKHRQRLPDVGRRTRRVYLGSKSVTVLGPCDEYTPDDDLADTDFDVDYGDGCRGPSRLAMVYREIFDGNDKARTIVFEKESDSPLLLSTDDFVHSCGQSSLMLYAELEFTSLDLKEVECRFLRASDDVVQASYKNTLFRWAPMVAGYLQGVSTTCNCVTFPEELCLSVPTR